MSGFSVEGFEPAVRRSHHGRKWREAPEGALPACIAEMDFPLAEPLAERLAEIAARRDLGYPAAEASEQVTAALGERLRRRHGLAIDPGRTTLHSSATQALALAILEHTLPGEAVLVHAPYYDGFPSLVEGCGRRLVVAPLAAAGAGYELDLEATRAVLDGSVRAILISNPHNPTGRVFSERELAALAELAIERDLVLLSDEVHAELVFSGRVHRPLAGLGPEVARRTVSVFSPSKAFALPGLRIAARIRGPDAREGAPALPAKALGAVGVPALELARLAWGGACDAWLRGAVAYLEESRATVARFAARAGLGFAEPEGSFLAWLDGRGLGLGAGAAELFLRRGRVVLRDGGGYGAPGFVRLNFATTRPTLDAILERMALALGSAG